MFEDFMDEVDEERSSSDDEREEEAGAAAALLASLPAPRENPQLLGHDATMERLAALMTSGKAPHALIFSGQKGVGKSTAAFRLARYLLSRAENMQSGKASEEEDQGGFSLFGEEALPQSVQGGEEPAPSAMAALDPFDIPSDSPIFRKIVSGGHPDFLFIERPFDEKKDRRKASIDVESAREIAPFMRMTSAAGGWRVVIVDDADTLTRNAQNAILKILEEPPPQSLLILVCHRLGAMIPTIRSRCHVIPFLPLEERLVMDLLARIAGPHASARELALFASMAGGSAGRAAGLYQDGGYEAMSNIVTLLSAWPQWDWPAIHHLADTLSRADEESAAAYQSFCEVLLWIVRQMLMGTIAGSTWTPPAILDVPGLRALQASLSMPLWCERYDHLAEHFETIIHSALDKRQGVLGAFAILGDGVKSQPSRK